MPESEYTRLTVIELERIAPLSEAARLAGVSKDTLQRHHADKILKLSPRRLGMRVRDALDVSASASNSTKIVSPEISGNSGLINQSSQSAPASVKKLEE
jgi:hypothetical protein